MYVCIFKYIDISIFTYKIYIYIKNQKRHIVVAPIKKYWRGGRKDKLPKIKKKKRYPY